MEELKLPELGENIDNVEVSAVLVAVGDAVSRDQPVIEVETEKASLEVPSTIDGKVTEVLVKVGDTVKVGKAVARLDAAVEEARADDPAAGSKASARAADAAEKEELKEEADDGVPAESEKTGAESEAAVEKTSGEPAAGQPPDRGQPDVAEFPAPQLKQRREIGSTVAASPSTRRLARELGVEIDEVSGSGPGGRISRDDVKAHAKRLIRGGGRGTGGAAAAAPALPDFARWGEIERQPLTNVRRATVAAMASSWSQVPHVTQFDRADITQLESMRRRFNQRPEVQDRKLTVTAVAIKLVAAALKQFPKFNSSLDVAGDAVIHKKYVHIGVAVDTERGLLVPVIRDVDRKSVIQVAGELGKLAGRARDRKLSPDEMRGATFTVSNLGGLGTTYFSPIVNWPEVAILGIGRAEQQAVFEDGRFEPRLMMPLSVSYDHRLIDGADAARFLRWLAEALEQPLLLLLDE